jgi:hypothetical protein
MEWIHFLLRLIFSVYMLFEMASLKGATLQCWPGKASMEQDPVDAGYFFETLYCQSQTKISPVALKRPMIEPKQLISTV